MRKRTGKIDEEVGGGERGGGGEEEEERSWRRKKESGSKGRIGGNCEGEKKEEEMQGEVNGKEW
jgi:hypothetical protein